MNRIDKAVASCADHDLKEQLQAACRAALTAGSLLKTLFPQPHTITLKGQTNLVTEADVAAEAAIIASLNEDSPGIPVLAEESAAAADMVHDRARQLWVVDPLDGTTNYAHGFPYFGPSIALIEQGQPRVCAVHVPCMDELFCACAGSGAWLNGEPIAVTETPFLVEALIGTGFPYDIHAHVDELTVQLKAILPKVRDIRRAGAAAVDLAYVACGRLDGFYEQELQPWDTAAGMLLVQEAGGKVTDYAGKPFTPFCKQIVASNSQLHARLLSLLA